MDQSVENMDQGIVLDDAVQAPEEQPQGESLSEITEEVQQPAEPEAPAKEPGWIRGRIDKAVSKAVKEAEARVAAQYEAMLAPIRESVLDRQAEDLVRAGEFKSLDTAKEYLRLKSGAPQPAEQIQPSVPQSQPQAVDPVSRAKADVLLRQAEKIKANRGLDVMAVYNQNPDVQEKILSGEWDFYDVAEAMGQRRTPLAPVRSPNGIGVNAVSIQNMSEDQFKRLQANLASGRKYDLRK